MTEQHDYKWSRDSAGGWRIGFGPSNFLVAEGSCWSLNAGAKLLEMLRSDPDWSEWWNDKERSVALQMVAN